MNVFIIHCTRNFNIIITILTWLDFFNWFVLICFHDFRSSVDLSWNELTEFNLFSIISVDCYISNFEIKIYIHDSFIYCIQFCQRLLLYERYFNRNSNLISLSSYYVCHAIIYYFSSLFFLNSHLFPLLFLSDLVLVFFVLFLVCHFLRNFIYLMSANCVSIFIIYHVIHFSIYIIVNIKNLVLFIHWNYISTAFNRWKISELTGIQSTIIWSTFSKNSFRLDHIIYNVKNVIWSSL